MKLQKTIFVERRQWRSVRGLFAALAFAFAFAIPVAAQDVETIPPDVELVTASLVYEMQHGDPAGRVVSFGPENQNMLREENFSYTGFNLANIRFTGAEQLSDAPLRRMIAAVAQFNDSHNRAALAYLQAEYLVEKNELKIERSWVRPFAPTDPRLEVVVVPLSAVDAAGGGIYDSWESLYTFATQNKVSEEAAKSRDWYVLYVFCMDRIAPDADFYAVVGKKSRDTDKAKSLAKPVDLDYDGYRVSVIKARFRIGNAARRFYVNVQYRPGLSEDRDSRTRCIGKFDSAAK
ncbi:MAG: hypothetical protein AB7E32_01550 [Desulfovibrio sp.]